MVNRLSKCTAMHRIAIISMSLVFGTPMCLALPYKPDLPVVYPQSRSLENSTRFNREEVRFPITDGLKPQVDNTGKPPCVNSARSTFCESVPNYPAEDIRSLVKFNPKDFRELFGSLGISNRRTISHEDIAEEPVCRHRVQTFIPKLAKSDENKWRYVVNDIDYVQAVVAEICEKEGSQCSYVQESLPIGYNSICRQRYSYKKLLAIDPDNKKTYMDQFPFPSCCSCHVKVPSLYDDRINNRRRDVTPVTRNQNGKK